MVHAQVFFFPRTRSAWYNTMLIMPLAEIVLIALGLSMDAFAVSVAAGLSLQRNCFPHALQRGLIFGAFQAGMPILGWLGGMGFRPILEPLDHWIAFGLLAVIGTHMIVSSWKSVVNPKPSGGFAQLIMLGIATSIDALAVGMSLAMLKVRIWYPSAVIGVITAALSVTGILAGEDTHH